ncbi:unnamed protein product [Strongylus vulgaris]|uniref:Uncharacterized protein n=1 Tax=Strongylus vulgaris TaxID=40348 RepID=A0A3P7JHH7_STRVU|nr:unnamed protein product [Strongylus vulgaris]
MFSAQFRHSAVFFQILSALLWSRVNQGMRLLLLVLIGCVAASNIVEGSGDDSATKHSVSSPDVEIHGSGYGSDDEDGDSIHGSGASIVEVVEGSGKVVPSIQQRPQVTTTTTTTHIPPVHSTSDLEQSHFFQREYSKTGLKCFIQAFNPVVPIRQLPKDDMTTTKLYLPVSGDAKQANMPCTMCVQSFLKYRHVEKRPSGRADICILLW